MKISKLSNPINNQINISREYEPSRRILITGGSSGIGLEASKQLMQRGHQLILLCRTEERCTETVKTLSARKTEHSTAKGIAINLKSLEEIEAGCSRLLQNNEPIDTLILNAGIQNVGIKNPQFTKQGIEETFCVNHLAHQLILMRLLPLLQKSNRSRLVITSSEVHNPVSGGGRVGKHATLGTLVGLRTHESIAMLDGRKIFDADKAYKDSKLCNILMARYISNRLKQMGKEIPVLAWSPGLVIPKGSNGFFRTSSQQNPIGMAVFTFVARDLLRLTETLQKAGALLAELADGDSYYQRGFRYMSNQLISPGRHLFKETETSNEGNNEQLGQELWTLSENLINQKLQKSL
jgi:protochlorophyllide reductase